MRTVFAFLFIASVLSTFHCVSQNKTLIKAEGLIQKFEADSALNLLKTIDLSELRVKEKAFYHLLKGNSSFSKSNHDMAFADFIEARRIYTELKDTCNLAKTDLLIVEVLSHQTNNMIPEQPFLEEYINASKICGKPIDEAIAYSKLAVVYLDVDNAKLAIQNFDKAIEIATGLNDTLFATNFLFNKGVVYETTLKKYDSALYFFKKTVPFYIKTQSQEYLSYNYNNQAQAYKKMGNYPAAIKYYNKADSIPLRQFNLKTKKIFYSNMADLYSRIGRFDSAFSYSQKLSIIKDSINETAQNVSMATIKEQYDNEKLRADNLEIESKRTQNRNIAIGLGGSLFGVALIGFLVVKNTRRKHYITEQQRKIEIQKTEKILKEQELTTIDAMIAGQEKERERLASDLHDSVGATLAAAKMQFNHLKNNKGKLINEDELFESTNSLLEDAYTEIRTMSHLKNSGVLAKNGLLPAVKRLAKNGSATSNLTIEVQDFGLDERLDNSLEIAIFRIIQELVTNIIKHSKASEASISMTQHNDSLSIIVEDNGQGFDVKKTPLKDGMGLSSIERRVEHLEGTMEVDSTPGKGTSVLIDIPI